MKKKTIAILMAAMLVCGGAAGATMAWLTDSSQRVTNTFTYGDININLTETMPENQTAKMIPGSVIKKDPKVTVEAGSEPCYVFVKIEPTEEYATFFGEFEAKNVEDDWYLLPGEENVYYQIVNPNGGQSLTSDEDLYVLKNNEVQVLDTVRKKDMEGIEAPTASKPTLSFTAYAVQLQNIETPQEAWEQIAPNQSSD